MNTKVQSQKNWKVKSRTLENEKKWFSSDDVINAYFKGKKDQKEDDERILIEKFDKNLKKAQEVCAKFFHELISSGIKCKFLKLRAIKITEFDAIIIVSENDFISDSFEDTYNKSFNIAEEVNSKTFRIDFNFMPNSKNIDSDKLISDGYVMTYGQK